MTDDQSTHDPTSTDTTNRTRRNVLAGTGALVASAAAGTALFAGTTGAENDVTFELTGDAESETVDGNLEYVALDNYESKVEWSNYGTEIEYIQATKHIDIEEDGGDDYEADKQVTETAVVEADETGSDGSYELVAADAGVAFVIIGDAEAGDHDPLNTESHNPFDRDGDLDVDDDDGGESRTFTVTVEQTYDLYEHDDDEDPVDSTTASDDFELTVTNIEGNIDQTTTADVKVE